MTIRAVEAFSARIAAKHGNDNYWIPLSRLSEIETKGVLPSAYRFYSLSVIYRRDLRELLSWYGLDVNQTAADWSLVELPKSHVVEQLESATAVKFPVRLDPTFDLRHTASLGPLIKQWGVVPLSSLAQFANPNYTYGYIGTEDWTMYPIVPPGSFVQIDEDRNKVVERVWRSEYERPIYFVETRAGWKCCWCSIENGHITLQPHPLSPEPVRIFRHPQEAEVIGEVIGVAMRLGERRTPQSGEKG
ncbi:MAG: hypothetical protein ACE14M_14895 [Terriglobales bacterium]